MSVHDQTKLCCGPFCAECEVKMVAQDEEVARLKEAVRVLAERLHYVEIRHSGNVSMGTLVEALSAVHANPIASEAVKKASGK